MGISLGKFPAVFFLDMNCQACYATISSDWRSYKLCLHMWVRGQWRKLYGSDMRILLLLHYNLNPHQMHALTHRFANNKIVRAYSLVLASYNTNSDAINHVVVRMLHRIAVDLKMAPLLYQISVFRTMQAVLHEPRVERLKVALSAH